MQILTILALAVFIGYVVLVRGGSLLSQFKSQYTEKVAGETSPSQSPANPPSIIPSVTPQVSSKPEATISSSPSFQGFIYPGVQLIAGLENQYQTSDAGNTVYNWYKTEMEKNTYQIRTNIKTRANDKFRAVLQGTAKNGSIKITIEQEKPTLNTTIILE